ncbi:MAG: hypothetical protein GFH27_549367n3 [Chloroflexi bacterium AL-W]|nr:hypothetical protein [Chloroflexi bacterium AL-W]
MVKVKICGVTTFDDALFAAQAGADLLGLNFYKSSPRYITPEDAQVLCDNLRSELGAETPVLVGVFVNEVVGKISAITNQVGLDAAQLHGDESDNMLKELRGIAFKAIQPLNVAMAQDDLNYYAPTFPQNERLPSLLLDAYHPTLRGGTGEMTGTEIIVSVRDRVPRLMIAGGLTAENVGQRVTAIHVWGVDVASGVENGTPGVKDRSKVQTFIQAAKSP